MTYRVWKAPGSWMWNVLVGDVWVAMGLAGSKAEATRLAKRWIATHAIDGDRVVEINK